jgi:hypothetical protein
MLHLAVPVDEPREHLGPAEIDADDTFSVQGAWLPYCVDGEG